MRDKYAKEVLVRRAQIEVARVNLERARFLLELHEVRAPTAGIVEEILRQPGEGAAELDIVIRIRRK